jgi:hypothetical protein
LRPLRPWREARIEIFGGSPAPPRVQSRRGRAISSRFHGGFILPSRTVGMVDTMENNLNGGIMKSTARNLVTACALGALGVALAAGGIYVGETDDAPGAALLGLLLPPAGTGSPPSRAEARAAGVVPSTLRCTVWASSSLVKGFEISET